MYMCQIIYVCNVMYVCMYIKVIKNEIMYFAENLCKIRDNIKQSNLCLKKQIMHTFLSEYWILHRYLKPCVDMKHGVDMKL